MQTGISIANVRLPVSRIVFGCACGPMLRGERVHALLDAVYACGVTAFDTAENYGQSEISLGNWIADRGLRERVTVITKGCHPYGRDRVTPEDLRADLEQSLRRLKTDYIDVYFLHRDDLHVPVGPLVEVLNEYHRAGKIGAFGGSNWTHRRIAEANAYARAHGLRPFGVSSPNFSLANQVADPWGGSAGCVTISGPGQQEARAFYRLENIPVFAYSSLGRGLFSGRVRSGDPEGAKQLLDEGARKGYLDADNFRRLARVEKMAAEKGATVPQIALSWLLNQDFTVFPIVSTTSGGRMRENLRALEIPLTPEELRWLDLDPDGQPSQTGGGGRRNGV